MCLKRSLIIFGLGIFLSLFPNFDFENLRVAGVLQRIALVYLGCSLLYLNSNFKSQLYTGIALLISYWVFMMLVPFDGNPAGTLEPGKNFAAWVDSFIVPGRMYKEIYKKRNLAPENLSRTLEDTGTVTSVLVPWNTCGAYHYGILGVSTFAYLPYCFFNLISPLMTLLYAYTKIKIRKIKK